jgi:predicted component of type VI protein secretion system
MTLRLRTLGRFSGHLPPLSEAPNTTPFEIYLVLRELLGELVAMSPGLAEFKCAAYNHDNPWPSLEALDAKIRQLLVPPASNILEVKFQNNAKEHPQAALTDEHFTRPVAYFLGVKTRVDRTALVKYVTDGSKFKFMPASLEGSAIFGVEVREENFAPVELPAEPGLYFFRLAIKENRRWQVFQNDKSAVLEWKKTDFDLSDASFSLYMTLPS